MKNPGVCDAKIRGIPTRMARQKNPPPKIAADEQVKVPTSSGAKASE
jgi:hypothetical protein